MTRDEAPFRTTGSGEMEVLHDGAWVWVPGTAAARIKELEKQAARLSRGEWFYDADDGENGFGDWSDALDYNGDDWNGPMQVCGAREVERFWVARIVVTRDAYGDPDKIEVRRFATKEEALDAMTSGQGELALATQPSGQAEAPIVDPSSGAADAEGNS